MLSSFMYEVLQVMKQSSKLSEHKMKEWKEIVFQYTTSKYYNMNKDSKNMINKNRW